MNLIFKPLLHELKHHLPFTALATIIGIALSYFFIGISLNISETIFESLHILHLLASSIVTAATFYKYRKNNQLMSSRFCDAPKWNKIKNFRHKKNIFQAILVGVSGSIIIGSLSDIVFPYLGALFFNLTPSFHLPIFEMPIIIISTSIIGSLIGIKILKTELSHTLHVGISVFASLFYLISYSMTSSIWFSLLAFSIVLIAVIIPCCVSDLLFPFFFLGEKIKHCEC